MFETDNVAPSPQPPPGMVGTAPDAAAFLERREPTVELEDLASADLHESVHSPSPLRLPAPGSASMLSRSNGDTGTYQDLGGGAGGGGVQEFGKTTATTELMDQLSALRKRLEGEQKRVDTQLKAGDAQYSKLANQSRRRKEQQVRVDEADDVVGQVLAQLKDVQDDDFLSGDAPTAESAIGAVFVKGGVQATPPPDDGVLSHFNQMKYLRSEGTEGAPSAQSALINAFPEPPSTDNALDVQQRAMIQAQERELELLRGRLGTTLDRNGTLASLASTGSFNLDIVTAKNEERLRRLNHSMTVPAPNTSNDILESFLNESAVRGLGGGMFAPPTKQLNATALGELNADSSYRMRD